MNSLTKKTSNCAVFTQRHCITTAFGTQAISLVLIFCCVLANKAGAQDENEIVKKREEALNVRDQGKHFLDTGQNGLALTYFEQYSRLQPKDPQAFFWQGLVQERLGKMDKAMDCYVQSVNLSDHFGLDSAELRNNLGNVLMRLNYKKEALFDYQRALKIDPNNFALHRNYALALIKVGDIKTAKVEADACLKLNPRDPEAHHLLQMVTPQAVSPSN